MGTQAGGEAVVSGVARLRRLLQDPNARVLAVVVVAVEVVVGSAARLERHCYLTHAL